MDEYHSPGVLYKYGCAIGVHVISALRELTGEVETYKTEF